MRKILIVHKDMFLQLMYLNTLLLFVQLITFVIPCTLWDVLVLIPHDSTPEFSKNLTLEW